jgi:hypothetical protein
MKTIRQSLCSIFTVFAFLLCPSIGSAAPSSVTLDLLIFYDKAANQYFNNEVDTAMQSWVNQMNTFNANSEAKIRWRIVGIVPREGVGAKSGDVLGSLYDDDQRNSFRTRFGADFVVQLAAKGDVCGIGYVANSAGGAFNVMDPGCGPMTMAHELGHNMGLQHSRLDGRDSGARFRYGLGYVVPGKFGDIMSYAANHNATRIGKYSNPRQMQSGEPFGIAAGLPNEADAVLAINNAIEDFYRFRASKFSDSEFVYGWGFPTWNQDGFNKATTGDVFIDIDTLISQSKTIYFQAKKTGAYTEAFPSNNVDTDQWKYLGRNRNGWIFIKTWGDGWVDANGPSGTAGDIFLVRSNVDQYYALKFTGHYYSTPSGGVDNAEWKYLGSDYNGINFLRKWDNNNRNVVENELFVYDNPYSHRLEYFRSKRTGSYWYFPTDGKDNDDWRFTGLTRSTCPAGIPC